MENRADSLKVVIVSWVFFLTAVLFGCGGVNPDKPVVTIDDESVITAGDYLYHYHRVVDKTQPGDKPVIETLDDARSFLDDLITGRVLEIEAEARGYGDDPVLQRDVNTHRREILYDMLVEDILAEIAVADEDVREFYDRKTHPRYVSLIATKTEKKAEEAKKTLDSGRPFEEVVETFSEDGLTRRTGGKSPEPITYHTVPAHDAIFDLEDKGDYTDVIYRKFFDMYFIYKYDGDAEPIELDYETEKEKIREKLENYGVNNVISEGVDKLRDGAVVERNKDVYDDVLSLSVAEVGEKHFNPITVIATVNGSPIYFDDFWDHFVYKLKFSGIDPDAFRRSNPEGFKEAVEKALDGFVRRALMEVEAERRGITEREDFVREMNRFRAGKLVDRIYKEVFVPAVPKVTDEEITAYYERHKEDYALPETMEGICIILKDRSLVGELRTVAGTSGFKTAADNAFVYLVGKYGEESFKGPSPPDEIVKRFRVTKDPSYQARGNVEEPEYSTRLREYVFDYPEGALSPVMDLEDGRYLIFLNEKYTAYEERLLDDKDVYLAARADANAEVMLSDETDRKSREWFDGLKAKHKIVVDEKVLRTVFKEIKRKES